MLLHQRVNLAILSNNTDCKEATSMTTSSIRTNYQGHPQQTRTAQQKQRFGVTSEDLPVQVKSLKTPFKGAFTYRIGPPKRPSITHDQGHLVLKPAAPTMTDRANFAKWKAIAGTAETIRPDLVDALAAYNHFLEGKGAARTFSYDRYVTGDKSGRVTLNNAINHIKLGVIDIWLADPTKTSFNVTGPAIPCGASLDKYSNAALFPYPETENWQKALGAHTIWLSGQVNVVDNQGTPHFYLLMTLHAEDMYNFNLGGQKDIVTGIPDNINGRFTQTRLAHPYLNTAKLTRSVSWKGVLPKEAQSMARQKARFERDRQPEHNRLIWNQI